MTTGEVLREKIARAIEDNLKSQGIRVVVDIAAQPDVRHICDGMLSLGALADAVLALIASVMEENERVCTICTATVARFPEAMCCHCYEMPWPIKHTPDEARATLSPKSESDTEGKS
jgi:hypothetical protein